MLFLDPDGRAEVRFVGKDKETTKSDFAAVRAKAEQYGMDLFDELDAAPRVVLIGEGGRTKAVGGYLDGVVAAKISWDRGDPTIKGPDNKMPEEGVINGPEREWGEAAGEPVRVEHGGVPIEKKQLFQHE